MSAFVQVTQCFWILEVLQKPYVFKVKKGDMMFQDKLVILFENPHSVIVS